MRGPGTGGQEAAAAAQAPLAHALAPPGPLVTICRSWGDTFPSAPPGSPLAGELPIDNPSEEHALLCTPRTRGGAPTAHLPTPGRPAAPSSLDLPPDNVLSVSQELRARLCPDLTCHFPPHTAPRVHLGEAVVTRSHTRMCFPPSSPHASHRLPHSLGASPLPRQRPHLCLSAAHSPVPGPGPFHAAAAASFSDANLLTPTLCGSK